MKGRESEQEESDHIQEEEERRLTHSPLPSGSDSFQLGEGGEKERFLPSNSPPSQVSSSPTSERPIHTSSEMPLFESQDSRLVLSSSLEMETIQDDPKAWHD